MQVCRNHFFTGKTALVTGAGSGIGKACVQTLARGGANMVIADRVKSLGDKLVADVKNIGSDAVFLQVDVTDPHEAEKMIKDSLAAFGSLDICVNNAGNGKNANLTGDCTIDGWNRVIAVNLNSVFYCMRYEILQMVKQNGGIIVNITTILGTVGFATVPVYTAVKQGIISLTKTAALEYGNLGIRINAVGPGFINTPLESERLGEHREVAELIAFLCSDEASSLTGGYYLADGRLYSPVVSLGSKT